MEHWLQSMKVQYMFGRAKIFLFCCCMVKNNCEGFDNIWWVYQKLFENCDTEGNVIIKCKLTCHQNTRHVARPSVISTFVEYSNCVDMDNQARQF